MPELTDLTGGFELAHSIAYLERAFEQARAGEPATAPFSDGVMPTVVDRTLAPEGKHVVAVHARFRTSGARSRTPTSSGVRDRVIAGYEELAPASPTRCCTSQAIGPHEMERERA